MRYTKEIKIGGGFANVYKAVDWQTLTYVAMKELQQAVHCLQKTLEAYRGLDRTAEWNKYLAGLIVKHARKSSLHPQLEALQ